MFDFAISRNQRRRPTRRFLAASIASCLTHLLMLLSLIEYPQLLQGGMYHHFRAAALIANLLGEKPDNENENWRTVAVLKSSPDMVEPSAATLKKYLYDWNKKGSGSPAVRIRWGDVKATLLDNAPPMPRVRKGAKEPDLSLPANEIASAGSAPAVAGPAGGQPGDVSGASTAAPIDSSAGRKGTVSLPPPGPTPKSDIASNTAPTKIPDSIPSPPASGPKSRNGMDSAKVFENEQKAIHSPDSGIFDTKGFPLGEYATLIKERIEGKWFIPSNLKNSQGHTTVVFYIDRDGRFMNARIVTGSGSSSLDLAALNAVLESDHAPPLPKGFPGDHIGVKFVFSYNEPP